MARWNGEPDHQEPVDPSCPCGTCAGYTYALEQEEYQRYMEQQQAEEYAAIMQAEQETNDDQPTD